MRIKLRPEGESAAMSLSSHSPGDKHIEDLRALFAFAPDIEITRDPERTRNTWPFDVTGFPAISVPCGFSRSGLPIGLQIVGAPFAESTVLALAYAYAYEQATEWHRRKTTLSA